MPKAITYIDLFSGIGGFREGLSRAGGFVCVGHCEIDKYADQSYQESIFFGLSTRQFLCSLLAVGVAVGIYFGLRPFVGSEEVGWMCILGAAPFAACGFFKYHGMTAEKLAWAWFKSEFLYPKKLVFQSDSLYYQNDF